MSIELGTHEARPVKYEFGQSGTKKTEMVSVKFQFVGGANDGKQYTWNGYFTEKTAARTMDALEHCGWDGVDLKRLTGFGSKNVELVVDEELGSDDKMYPVIKWVNRLMSRGPATLYGEEELQSLSDRMAAINAERKRANAEKRGDTASTEDPFGNG